MGKIEYIRQNCIGCGVCEMLAPHIWAIDLNDGKANMLDADTTKGQFRDVWDDELDLIQEIITSCPPKAIRKIK